MIQNRTIKSPARLTRKACSSLPLCLRTWQRTETRIPTAAILKIILTSNIFLFLSCYFYVHKNRSFQFILNCYYALLAISLYMFSICFASVLAYSFFLNLLFALCGLFYICYSLYIPQPHQLW